MSVLESILTLLGLLKPAPVSGNDRLDIWVDLPITAEGGGPPGSYAVTGTSQEMSGLRAHLNRAVAGVTLDFVAGLIDKGLIRQHPADAAKFQVKLGLRVAYPASSKTPNRIAGNSPIPVVLLNHGQYNNWELGAGGWVPAGAGTMKPADIRVFASLDGYGYLQDALAALGLISVSLDHNFACRLGLLIETRADTIIAALDALSGQAGDKTTRYYKRLDFSRIGLMGHSRGGDAVVRAVTKIRADAGLRAKYTVKGVCSLAPTDFSGSNPPASRIFLDYNDLAFYAVVYGALDNDVSGAPGANSFPGTGFRHYDRARCPKSMVFLDGCCHDFFNTVWAATPAEQGLGDPRIAAPSVHLDILVDYLTDLFTWQLGGTAKPGRFDGRIGNRAGQHASLQWMFGQQIKKIDDFENPAANLLGGARAVLSIGQPAAIQDFSAIAITGNSMEQHTSHQTHVLHADLTLGVPGSTRLLDDTIPGAEQDWSKLDTVIINLSGWFDPTSDATIAATNLPRVKVTLTDSANVSASIDWNTYGASLPSRPIFKSLPGAGGNLTLMRLETIPIPLSDFSGPDLTKVATLSLDVDPSNGTHVMIDSIHVVQR
jgi:hypothetical protein